MAKIRNISRLLGGLPRRGARSLSSAISELQPGKELTSAQAEEAFDVHSKTRLPLRMALELQLGIGRTAASNSVAMRTAQNLQSSYNIKTRNGRIRITPSFSVKTAVTERNLKRLNKYSLPEFTSIAFRVMPAESEKNRFSSTKLAWPTTSDHNSVQIFEIGFGILGKKPVVIITNAQAKKEYYSMPWELKKTFADAYDEVLMIVQKASGGLPVLIPSNQTVNDMLQSHFGHTISNKVLDEFYDKFSEKRGRRKTRLKIKNPVDGKSFTAEFWVKKSAK